jgi:hypothetical protein
MMLGLLLIVSLPRWALRSRGRRFPFRTASYADLDDRVLRLDGWEEAVHQNKATISTPKIR